MNKIKEIIKWPQKLENSYRPLYEIVWRMIWYPVLVIGIFTAALALVCTGDKDYAEDLIKDYTGFL